MRLRTLLVLPALAGALIPCAAVAQVNTRPRTLPSVKRAKERADAKLPPPSRAPAAAPRTGIFGGVNFAGIPASAHADWADYTPPDSTGAIGPSHYIELVNSRIAAYPRAGGAPVLDKDLQTWINDQTTPDLLQKADSTDPIGHPGDSIFDVQVQWDQHSQRWLFAADDVEEKPDETTPGLAHLVFGWSTTADPTDPWCLWRTDPAEQFDDFPKLGHSDGFMLIGTNVFANSDEGSAMGSRIWAMPKPTGPIGSCGARPALTTFQPSSFTPITPVPANVGDDSATGYVVSAGSSTIRLYTVTDDGMGNPQLSGPSNVAVPSYSRPPDVQQPGTSTLLDSQDARLTQAVAMTDPGSGDEMVWTQHTVASADGKRAEVRWYEIDGDDASLAQRGTIADLANSVFNAAISPAADGTTAAIDYNVGGRGRLVEVRAQTRRSTTPLGVMRNERTLMPPSSAVDADFSCTEGPSCRWGDYAGASPDPDASNTNVVWGTNQLNGSIRPDNRPSWLTGNFALEYDDTTDPLPAMSLYGFPFTSSRSTPTFNFDASETGTAFRCRIDGGAFAPCTPGDTFGPALANGTHTFEAFAIDASGQQGPYKSAPFTVNAPLPDTAIDSGPPASTFARSASFAFHGTKPGSTFQCSFDGSAFAACVSPFTSGRLALGRHSFAVRSIDTLGNVDPTPAASSFSVKREPFAVVAAHSQRASRTGRVKLRVRCPANRITTCTGSVTLQLSSNHHKLGSARFRVKPGRTATVRLKLTRSARKLLQRKPRLKVRALFRQTSPAKRTTKTFRLSAPRRRRS